MKQELNYVYWLKMHYVIKIVLRGKSEIKFDSMGVTLMELSSLHAAYGPGDFLYILVVIETTQTCLDSGGGVT